MERFRISLRLMLLLMALFAVSCGAVGLYVRGRQLQLNNQRNTIKARIHAYEWAQEHDGQDLRVHIADLRKQLDEL